MEQYALFAVKDLHPGYITIWEHLRNGRPTELGHAGIVVGGCDDGTFLSVEGNTWPGAKVQREGDGVFLKSRAMNFTAGPMRLKGFLRAWPNLDAPLIDAFARISPKISDRPENCAAYASALPHYALLFEEK